MKKTANRKLLQPAIKWKSKYLTRFLMKQVNLPADIVALSIGVVPNPENAAIGQMLKVPTNQDGFFLEAHVKLRPVDFATDGVFMCGMSHSPKFSDESITQANAAVSRACHGADVLISSRRKARRLMSIKNAVRPAVFAKSTVPTARFRSMLRKAAPKSTRFFARVAVSARHPAA